MNCNCFWMSHLLWLSRHQVEVVVLHGREVVHKLIPMVRQGRLADGQIRSARRNLSSRFMVICAHKEITSILAQWTAPILVPLGRVYTSKARPTLTSKVNLNALASIFRMETSTPTAVSMGSPVAEQMKVIHTKQETKQLSQACLGVVSLRTIKMAPRRLP